MLNRFPQSDESDHTLQILKYMFPRQFGLHNVFTSSVDKSETVQPFKDYTLREQEIDQMQRQELLKRKNPTGKVLNHPSLPKRLRGLAIELVKKLQKLHARCAYKELLKHYCPVDVSIVHDLYTVMRRLMFIGTRWIWLEPGKQIKVFGPKKGSTPIIVCKSCS